MRYSSGLVTYSMLMVCLKVCVQSYVGRGKAVVIRNSGAEVGHLESQQKAALSGNHAQEQSGAY